MSPSEDHDGSLRLLRPTDIPTIGDAAAVGPTSVRWLSVAEVGSPETIQRAISSDVALQWIVVSAPEQAPRCLIQVTSLDLRSQTGELHLQLLGPLSQASDLSASVAVALGRTLLAFPIRQLYCHVVEPWRELYELALPQATLAADIPDFYFYDGAYRSKLIYCVGLAAGAGAARD